MSYFNPGDAVTVKGVVGSVVNGYAYIRSANGSNEFVISIPDEETSAVEVTRAARVFKPGDLAYFPLEKRIRQRHDRDHWEALNFSSKGVYADKDMNRILDQYKDHNDNVSKVFRNGIQIY